MDRAVQLFHYFIDCCTDYGVPDKTYDCETIVLPSK